MKACKWKDLGDCYMPGNHICDDFVPAQREPVNNICPICGTDMMYVHWDMRCTQWPSTGATCEQAGCGPECPLCSFVAPLTDMHRDILEGCKPDCVMTI